MRQSAAASPPNFMLLGRLQVANCYWPFFGPCSFSKPGGDGTILLEVDLRIPESWNRPCVCLFVFGHISAKRGARQHVPAQIHVVIASRSAPGEWSFFSILKAAGLSLVSARSSGWPTPSINEMEKPGPRAVSIPSLKRISNPPSKI